MNFDLFQKAWRTTALQPEERSMVLDGFLSLTNAIAREDTTSLTKAPSVFAAMYAYAQRSAAHQMQIMALADVFQSEYPDIEVHGELKDLLGGLWTEIQARRTAGLLANINIKQTLAQSSDPLDYVSSVKDSRAAKLYENQSAKLNIDFSVSTLPFASEVLEARIVTVPAGKANELHRHAHETIFVFMTGVGRVLIDGIEVDVKPGSIVFIPRWCMHQSINAGESELEFLAVADYGLTGKSFVGNYLKTARLKSSQ